MELNDWSAFMQQVQINCKKIEDKLLHRNYNDMAPYVEAVRVNLDKTLAWIATQGQNAGVDIVPILEEHMKSLSETDKSRTYITAAIQEIKQLRGERQFWLQSGYSMKK